MRFKWFSSRNGGELQRFGVVWCPRDVILFPEATLAEAPVRLSQLYLAPGLHDSLK